MGASTFSTVGRGKSAKEAFKAARDEALHEYGHGGYTGSIAEKREFVMIFAPTGVEPVAHANALLDADDKRITDKRGPAGCIPLSGEEFLFFGWASS